MPRRRLRPRPPDRWKSEWECASLPLGISSPATLRCNECASCREAAPPIDPWKRPSQFQPLGFQNEPIVITAVTFLTKQPLPLVHVHKRLGGQNPIQKPPPVVLILIGVDNHLSRFPRHPLDLP